MVDLRVADPAWVVSLVWRLGGQATVLEPAEIAERVRAGAAEARAAYASESA